MKKVCVITGTRANYGRLKPVLNEIEQSSKLELKLIVTSMHLVRECGYTISEIEQDGYKISAKVDMHISNDSGAGMCKSLGVGLIGITQAIEAIEPDYILILGDRDEDLAGAIIGSHMNIPVAHIHGGEVTGTIDESIRHAITKFSHIHFAATEESKERILKLGEKEQYVFNVGSPGLDSILNREYSNKEDIFKKFDLDINKKLIILSQHPVTTQRDEAGTQMRETMKAISKLGEQTILIYPNSDAGSKEIIEVINEYSNSNLIHVYRNIKFEDYLNLLKYADVMVGNSSSGIMEAPSYHLPVVNIGIRQQGRERSTNVISVEHKSNQIYDAIRKSLFDLRYINNIKNCINPYGDGKSSKKIVKILEENNFERQIVQKKITY